MPHFPPAGRPHSSGSGLTNAAASFTVLNMTTHTSPGRRYVVYRKNANDKLGYVHAANRPKAREAAAAEWGGSPDDYFVASAR